LLVACLLCSQRGRIDGTRADSREWLPGLAVIGFSVAAPRQALPPIHSNASTAPRILEVDFDRLDAIPFERLAQRGDIPHRGETHLAEPVQAALAEALLAI